MSYLIPAFVLLAVVVLWLLKRKHDFVNCKKTKLCQYHDGHGGECERISTYR